MRDTICGFLPSYSTMLLKKIMLTFLALISISGFAFSQRLELGDEGSAVQFAIKNFGLTVNGSFKGLTGTFVISTDSVAKSHFEATVRAATIDTGITLRDKHLRDENYFDVKKHPLIKITSLKITKVNDQWSAVTAVTIKGITRQVTIPFTVERTQSNHVLKGSFELDRLEFGVGASSFSLAENVQIQLIVTGQTGK